jgi:hypothetical protein
MNHIKTFQQYSDNNKILNEGLFEDIEFKIKKILNDLSNVDENIINDLLLKIFIKTFTSEATKILKEKVLALPLEEKIKLLKEVYKKLEYSNISSLRLLKYPSGKFFVGSIKRPPISQS